jgi:hypothetical protein
VSSLRKIVVWIPMLDSDERPAADDISAMFADVAVPQFWDGEKKLGLEVSRSFGDEPDRAAWDVYLFYPPEAEWTDAGLPRAEKAIAQSMGVVIGVKGTLPPKGDQSDVPEWGKGAFDVVGEQPELGALLSAIAVPYADKYERASRTP